MEAVKVMLDLQVNSTDGKLHGFTIKDNNLEPGNADMSSFDMSFYSPETEKIFKASLKIVTVSVIVSLVMSIGMFSGFMYLIFR